MNAVLAIFLMLAGRQAEALEAALDLAKRFPTTDNAQGIACIVTSASGWHEEAMAFGWKSLELPPHTPAMHVPRACALALAGRHDEGCSGSM